MNIHDDKKHDHADSKHEVKDEPQFVGGFSPTTDAEDKADPNAKSVYDNIIGPIDPEAVLEEKAAGRPGRINEVVDVPESTKTIKIPASKKLQSRPAVEKRVADIDPVAIINDATTRPVVEADGEILDDAPRKNIVPK